MEALARRGFRNRLHLMSVKGDRLPIDPKDAGHIRMERSICDQCLDRGATLVMRIDGDQRLGPKALARIDFVDLFSDVLGANLCEGASEALVVRYECAIQIKNIHDYCCSSKQGINWEPDLAF